MNLGELCKSGKVIYEYVGGSHAYGTSLPTSDTDIRGIFYVPSCNYVSLIPPDTQIDDEKHDTTYYSLKRFFELIQTGNPNILESLWMPADCIKVCKSPIMDILLENRKAFISKKAYFSHAEYAIAQIKRAKGANKRVHNPQPETRPSKEDFCWIIDLRDPNNFSVPFDGFNYDKFPCRPVRLSDSDIELNDFHVSSLEHVPNVYRMYYYASDEGGKGVFRGEEFLTCASIPKEDEKKKFRGLLIFNKEEYERAVRDWKQYWDWMKNRNEHRWIDQEKGVLNYDQKNMMHCVRLMLAAENILLYGEPKVRFEGTEQEYLLNIRHGKFTYEELMKYVGEKEAKLKSFFEICTLPEDVDHEKLEKIYKQMMDVGLSDRK